MKELSHILDVFDRLPHGHCVFDENGTLIFWNVAMERWSGRSRDEVCGQALKVRFPKFSQPYYLSRLSQALQSGIPSVFSSQLHKYLIPCPAGDQKFQVHQYHVSGITGLEGTKFGLLTVENVTQATQIIQNYRDMCQQLLDQERKAQEATRAKSTFLASMSHEIRTPLNGIIGMTSLLQQCNLGPEEQDYIDTIFKSGENLLALINDILDISKIESGKLELEEIEIDIRKLAEDAMDSFADQAIKKKIFLSNIIDPLIPCKVIGDPTRTKQILLNFLSNALKFTKAGEIQLRVNRVTDQTKSHHLLFEVVDTGCGIEADKMNRLFQSFSQVDSSISRNFGGTGLGLSISKGLAQLMKGEVGADSQVGEGSRFWFTARYSWKTFWEHEPRFNFSEHDVLLISNSDLVLVRLRDLIFARGVRTVAVSHLDHLSRPKAGTLMHIVDANSFTETPWTYQSYCEQFVEAGDSIIFVVSQFPCSTEVRPPQAKFLRHPIRQAELYRFMELALNSDQLATKTSAAFDQFHKSQAHVVELNLLVAEDNIINQKVLASMLRKLGHSCDIVNNGLEAVQANLKKDYDLILMDCEMPKMNGYEASNQIRTTSSVPIVALTASALSEDRDRCLRAGMNDFMTKPVSITKLEELLYSISLRKAYRTAS